MTVKVLITRTVPREKERDLLELFTQMRALATQQNGYISGETLKSINRPDRYLIISTWEKAEDWETWLLSGDRQMIQTQIDALLGGSTGYEVFQYGIGK